MLLKLDLIRISETLQILFGVWLLHYKSQFLIRALCGLISYKFLAIEGVNNHYMISLWHMAKLCHQMEALHSNNELN